MTTDEALKWAELPKDEQALESLRHGDEIGWIELSEGALAILAAEVRRLRQRHAEAVEAAFRAGVHEGWICDPNFPLTSEDMEELWRRYKAKAGLT